MRVFKTKRALRAMDAIGRPIHVVQGTTLSLPAEQEERHWMYLCTDDGTSIGIGNTTLRLMLRLGHLVEN